MSELFVVIFATIGIGFYQALKFILIESSIRFYFQIFFIVILTILFLRYVYIKIKFKYALKEFEGLDVYDFKFYKTCNSFFNKASYIFSMFLYNTILEYKLTTKDFTINKNFISLDKENNDTEFYLKLRLRWYSYLKFTMLRTTIALKKAENFAFKKQIILLDQCLSEDGKQIYIQFESELKKIEDKKISPLFSKSIVNYNSLNYIYKDNLVKLHNNNIALKKYIHEYNFMNKKFQQYSNDIRSYKRLND